MGIFDTQQINIVKNPGFEEPNLKYWTYNPQFVFWEWNVAHSGKYSCRIRRGNPFDPPYIRQGKWPCYPGMPMTLTFWALGDVSNGIIWASFTYWILDAEWYNTITKEFIITNARWTPCRFTATMPYWATYCGIAFRSINYQEAWIDDVSIPLMSHPQVTEQNVLLTKRA